MEIGHDEKGKSIYRKRREYDLWGGAKVLGQRLRNVRRNKGLSHKVVAKLVGMRVSELRQIENGELDLHLSFVVAIAEVFDIRVSRLFHGIA